MMSTDTKLKRARESRGSPPVGSAHRSPKSAPIVFSQNLHSKGFGGGVPQNTETAAVKPRVGIEKITKRGLFFVEMTWAGRSLRTATSRTQLRPLFFRASQRVR